MQQAYEVGHLHHHLPFASPKKKAATQNETENA